MSSLLQAPRWSAELSVREHETKTKINWGEQGREGSLSLPFSRPNNFSRAFYFRVFPTIWEPGTSLRVAAPSPPRQRRNGGEGAGTRRLDWNRLFHEVFCFPLYKFHFLGFVIQSFVVPSYIHVDKTCVRDCFLRPRLIRTQWHVPLVSVVTGFHCILNYEIVLK